MEYFRDKGFRLVNSKFPPISIFDDSADADDFAYLYALQSLSNPRLQNEIGNISLIHPSEIPFGIKGCSYATAPFTHINKDGTRFSNADFGILYLADTWRTALAETKHHTQVNLANIEGLHFDTIVMRGLSVTFSANLLDIRVKSLDEMKDSALYDPNDYTCSQSFGAKQRGEHEGLLYTSVRNPLADCYALYSPKRVIEIIQARHYEYVWDGKLVDARQIKSICNM